MNPTDLTVTILIGEHIGKSAFCMGEIYDYDNHTNTNGNL